MTFAHRAGLLMLGAVAVWTPGCAGTLTVAGAGEGPNLVALGSGVWVVEGYSEPVFYADGYYWRYARDTWYSSRYLGGGWSYVPPPRVPPTVRRIDRPGRYAHYRAPRGTTVRPVPREDLRGPYEEGRYGAGRGYQERYEPRYGRPEPYERSYEPRYGERPYEARPHDERYDTRLEQEQRREAEESRREIEERRRELDELERLEREREAYRRELERQGYD